MTEPAAGPAGQARYCLRLVFEPMVKAKAEKAKIPHRDAEQAALAWLAGEMGLPVEQCRPYEMTAAETWLAVNVIREWRQARTKERDARYREHKREVNEQFERRRRRA